MCTNEDIYLAYIWLYYLFSNTFVFIFNMGTMLVLLLQQFLFSHFHYRDPTDIYESFRRLTICKTFDYEVN